MATVDDRVVAMSFENSRFESGVSQSMATLSKLKNSLKFSGATTGLDNIEKRASRMDLSGISNALDSIKSKFSGLGLAATAAFATVVQQATLAGMSMAKAFTVAPIMAGFKEYETGMNSVQTILSNTEASGTNLKDVNAALAELNRYADKTIYNFSEMTRNVGTFTAAGVDLKKSVASIKGIANLAALSGSNANQASTAMYQLSQAISAGRVNLQDWNSVTNAGIGGTIFQRALAQTAVHMGTLNGNAVKLKGSMKNVTIDGESFRNSIMAKPGQQSWLTGDVLTQTLSQLSGNLSDAELKAKGYSDAQVKAIQTQAKSALAAATQIKTLSQLLDTTKEAAGSGWANTFQLLLGDFGEAKTLFTNLGNSITGFATKSAKARNTLLKEWKDLGGRTLLLNSLKKMFQNLGDVLEPIKKAFRDIFPKETAKNLYDLTVRFSKFVDLIKPSPKTVENLRRTFRGFFAILDIGKQAISGILHFFGLLFGQLHKGSGGISDFTGDIGDVLYAFDQWLKKGDIINTYLEKLSNFLKPVTNWLSQFANGMGAATSAVAGSSIMDKAAAAWDTLVRAVQKVAQFLKPAIDAIVEVFRNTGELILQAIKGQNFDKVFTIIQTTLIGGLLLAIKNAIGGGFKVDIGQDAIKRVSGSLDTLRGSMMTMQQDIKANIILKIAAAVALLAASVVALSGIPPKKLASSMAAMAVGLGQLLGAMAVLGATRGAMFKAGPMLALAIAVDVLVIAVKALSKLNWAQLGKGLAGVTGALVAMSLATLPLQAAGPRLAVAAGGLIPLAISLVIISQAVRLFGDMDLETIGKGILGIGAALVVIGTGIKFVPPRTLVMGAGLLVLGGGLMSLGLAVKVFSSMPLETIGRGILSIAVALVAIGGAMYLMPITLPITAAGLILVGIALDSIAGAVSLMGHMSPETLVKGITAMAASFVVLALGLDAMMTALPGAAALFIVGAALAMFVPSLGLLASMKWGTILKGLAALAVTLLLFGTLGEFVAPGLIALATGLGALGLAMLTIGGAVYLLAAGVALLANKGVKGVAAFLAALTALVAALPSLIINFLKGLVQVLGMIAELAPKVVSALVVIIGQLLDGLIKLAPKFALAATALITAFLQVLADNAGPIITAGWTLLLQLLQGISDHIVDIVGVVSQIIIGFFNALGTHIVDIMKSGGHLLVKFLEGLTNQLGDVIGAVAKLVAKFISEIGSQKNVDLVVGAGAGFVIHILNGIGKKMKDIATAAVNLVGKFLDTIAWAVPALAFKAFLALHAFMWNLAQVIRDRTPILVKDFFNLGWALIEGLSEGLGAAAVDIATSPIDLAGHILTGVYNEAKKKAHVHSPSKLFMELGVNIIEGLTQGIESSSGQAINTVGKSTTSIANAMQTALGHVQANKDVEWRITPVVDMANVTAAKKSMSGGFPKIGANVDVPTVLSKGDALLANTPTKSSVFKFEQNNYSPKALSEREIYRQTHNQLSQAKRALKM